MDTKQEGSDSRGVEDGDKVDEAFANQEGLTVSEDDTSEPREVTETARTLPENDGADTKNVASLHVAALDRRKHFGPELIFPRKLREKLGRSARPLSLVVFALLVTVISVGAYAYTHMVSQQKKIGRQNFGVIVEPFKVVSTSPSNNQKNVNPDTPVTLTFNRPVDPEKLQNDFFAAPDIAGSFSQGKNPREIIFTPKMPFGKGTIVKIMINQSFQSEEGNQLMGGYTFGFTTKVPSDGVVFETGYSTSRLASAQSNTGIAFTLSAGDNIDPNGTVTTYRSSIDKLISSFTYSTVTDEEYDYTYQKLDSLSVDTTGDKQLDSRSIKDAAKFDVKYGKGVYLIVAESKGKQVGWTWVVFNDNGTVLRQDDQKIVLSAQNLTSHDTVSNAKVSFYNLSGSAKVIRNDTLDGVQSYDFPYEQKVDLAVVTSGDDSMVIPIAMPETLADLRVGKDLSNSKVFFATTDQPTYHVGDTVRFAGYVRNDNDLQYTRPDAYDMNVYAATSPWDDNHVADSVAHVKADGTFTGSFVVTQGFLAGKDTNQQLVLATQESSSPDSARISMASFTVATDAKPQYTLKLNFDQKTYMSSEKVVAHVHGTNSDGTNLANADVTYNVYSLDYDETSSSGLADYNFLGMPIGDQDRSLQLDENGDGTIEIPVSELPAGNSQYVTVQISKTDDKGIVTAAGASALIHQGDGILHFEPGRSFFTPDEERVVRVKATDLSGTPYENKQINYRFTTSRWNDETASYEEDILAEGTSTTDSNGVAEIRRVVNSSEYSIDVKVSMADGDGNAVQASSAVYTKDSDRTPVHSDWTLTNLDVIAPDTLVANSPNVITIESPADVSVLVSYERGRIFHTEQIDLKKGSNTYTINTSDVSAPSFSLIFSYFMDGHYTAEGVAFSVTSQKQLGVSVTSDKASYMAKDIAHLKVKVSLGANPVVARLIVSVVNDDAFNLRDSFTPNIFGWFYPVREVATTFSSSQTGIGSGVGRCGTGGMELAGLNNGFGANLYWSPYVSTDTSGNLSMPVALKSGTWHVLVYAMDGSNAVGMATTVLTVQ